jgi:hypothetical protein
VRHQVFVGVEQAGDELRGEVLQRVALREQLLEVARCRFPAAFAEVDPRRFAEFFGAVLPAGLREGQLPIRLIVGIKPEGAREELLR